MAGALRPPGPALASRFGGGTGLVVASCAGGGRAEAGFALRRQGQAPNRSLPQGMLRSAGQGCPPESRFPKACASGIWRAKVSAQGKCPFGGACGACTLPLPSRRTCRVRARTHHGEYGHHTRSPSGRYGAYKPAATTNTFQILNAAPQPLDNAHPGPLPTVGQPRSHRMQIQIKVDLGHRPGHAGIFRRLDRGEGTVHVLAQGVLQEGRSFCRLNR
jgi:hypothetical protein